MTPTRKQPFEPCSCGCWDWFAMKPEMQTWMAIYLDLLDRDADAALRMLVEGLLSPAIHRARMAGDL